MNEIPEEKQVLKPKKLEKEKQQENKSQYRRKTNNGKRCLKKSSLFFIFLQITPYINKL